MTQKLRPTYDRVIVEKIPDVSETKSGIIIPDVAQGKEPIVIATVLAVGEKVEKLKEGDKVGFSNGAGERWTMNGDIKQELIIIRDTDIIVVIEYEQ